MSEENDDDLGKTQELFEFLQGRTPDGYVIGPDHMPKLTPDQAATVIWYLGNQYWKVTDHVERCDVCGDWYDTWCEGATIDCPPVPIFFCGNCCDGEEAQRKRRIQRGLERAHKRDRKCAVA
ncbi:MAG: hypothetical protein WC378_01010 [Opitutaceae bacterium]|jgi:hypothetical protein